MSIPSTCASPPKSQNLELELFNSVENGEAEKVKKLIEARAYIEARDLYDYTPLHRAAIAGHEVVVKLLLDAGADKYARVPGGTHKTPMNYALMFKHLKVVQVLVEAGYDVNYKPPYNESRPLDDACRSGSDEIVAYLLEKGAKVKESPYAIFKATWNPKTLERMIKYGADIHVRLRPDDIFEPGAQPLHHAAATSCKESIKILLAAKADKSAKDAHGNTPLAHLIHRITYLRESGQMAAEKEADYKEMVAMLL